MKTYDGYAFSDAKNIFFIDIVVMRGKNDEKKVAELLFHLEEKVLEF